jgi:murein DD-endopeptidase MepM/ murein hydrolase activator NlpD
MAKAKCLLAVCLALLSAPILGDSTSYTIREGETLFGISKKYDIPIDVLCAFNGIKDADRVKVGTLIKFPQAYVIKKGDTLYSIARAFSVSVSGLQTLNKLSSTIRAGDRIFIPLAAGAETAPDGPSTASTQGVAASGQAGVAASRGPETSAVLPHNGKREPFAGKLSGLLFHGAPGDVVSSASSGEVRWVGTFWGWGKVAIIENDEGLRFIYAGNGDLLVNVGDRVKPGSEIAHLGVNPQGGGAVLYFCIADRNEKSIDPERFFSGT